MGDALRSVYIEQHQLMEIKVGQTLQCTGGKIDFGKGWGKLCASFGTIGFLLLFDSRFPPTGLEAMQKHKHQICINI